MPEWRKMGYGTILSEHVLVLFPRVNLFKLTVHPENKQAINLYQKLGFMEAKRLDNPYGDNELRVVMKFTRVKN